MKKSQKFAGVGGGGGPNPLVGYNFECLIFWPNPRNKSWNFCKLINCFLLYMTNFDPFLENFSIPNPYYSLSILYSLVFRCPARKLKNFGKICIFPLIFSINFQIFITLMHIFEKTPNFRALPSSKISFRPSKIGPPQKKNPACRLKMILGNIYFKNESIAWIVMKYNFEKFSLYV